MKKQVILLATGAMLLAGFTASSQILKKLGEKVENKVKQRIEQKADQTIDKGLDKAEDAAGGTTKTAGNKTKTTGDSQTAAGATQTVFGVNTDFDFVPGEKILFSDDFSKDHTGDFPVKWNTNGSGEVVSLSGQTGRWLKIPDNTLSFPETKGAFPENFTVEFDLYYPSGITRPPVTFGFSETKNPAKERLKSKKIFYFRIAQFHNDVGYTNTLYSGHETNKTWPTNQMAGKNIRVSISVNKQRIRLYLNQDKLFDLPKAFEPATLRNNFHFRAAPLTPAPKEGFYTANLRIAETGEDLRSKLLKDGRVSTTGILFDVSSAKIKEQSYGIIREIAAAVQENSSMRMKITGHTDSDGDDNANLQLSRKRADAVKNALVNDFKVDAARLEIAGQGEREPIAANSTAEGKAANRRVEFIKL